jgi:hypothetical protein
VIDLLIILLRPALLCVEGRQYRYLPFALLAWLVDIALAHTTWALIAGWPHRGEWTVSQTLERLCVDWNNPDVHLYRRIAQKINRTSPTGSHIKAVTNA